MTDNAKGSPYHKDSPLPFVVTPIWLTADESDGRAAVDRRVEELGLKAAVDRRVQELRHEAAVERRVAELRREAAVARRVQELRQQRGDRH